MALTQQSITRAVRKKAGKARASVKAAEEQLAAANETLRQAVPSHDVDSIVEAAGRTVSAEQEVRQAAQELEAVEELLDDSAAAPAPSGASGEGAGSLLPWLRGARPPE